MKSLPEWIKAAMKPRTTYVLIFNYFSLNSIKFNRNTGLFYNIFFCMSRKIFYQLFEYFYLAGLGFISWRHNVKQLDRNALYPIVYLFIYC